MSALIFWNIFKSLWLIPYIEILFDLPNLTLILLVISFESWALALGYRMHILTPGSRVFVLSLTKFEWNVNILVENVGQLGNINFALDLI